LLHPSRIQRVIFCMSPNKADIHHPPVVMHRHDQAVIVAFDIEHYAVASHEAGIAMCCLYVRWRFPDCPACIGIPSAQRSFRLRVLRPKISQRADGYHSHGGTLSCSRIGCNNTNKLILVVSCSSTRLQGAPWGLSRGFTQHAVCLQNGVRLPAHTRPARGWEAWQDERERSSAARPRAA